MGFIVTLLELTDRRFVVVTAGLYYYGYLHIHICRGLDGLVYLIFWWLSAGMCQNRTPPLILTILTRQSVIIRVHRYKPSQTIPYLTKFWEVYPPPKKSEVKPLSHTSQKVRSNRILSL